MSTLAVVPSRSQTTRNPNSVALDRVGMWSAPAVIQPNNFVHKSLSSWSFNIAIGCSHACRFCYVPSASTIKQGPKLRHHGVKDADAEWGDYVLLRPWDEEKFLASLRAAENTPLNALKKDGNRAVMYCTTTDAYQVIRHPDPQRQKELSDKARHLVRRSLELIRDHSTLNVRIMTRSPMARLDFDLFKSFGHRLMFGMSLPTLRNDLAKVYEPRAPAPSQRLETLRAAHKAGLHVYVAMAPTYPECDEADLRATNRGTTGPKKSGISRFKLGNSFLESAVIVINFKTCVRCHGRNGLGQLVVTFFVLLKEDTVNAAHLDGTSHVKKRSVCRFEAGDGGTLLATRIPAWPSKSINDEQRLTFSGRA